MTKESTIKPDDNSQSINFIFRELISKDLIFMAGPCAIESPESAIKLAIKVKKSGAHIFRGSIFKTRTSPYSFQGIGLKALPALVEIKKETGLKIITEVISIDQLEPVAQVADIIQIGARNMQNTPLLIAAAKTGKTILLKRGMSATVEEWISAAEYILNQSNNNIILCERGIRTFEKCTRNTLSLGGALEAGYKTGLPVIVDPSHSSGRSDFVDKLSLSAIAAGLRGLIIETHESPKDALSDPEQAITPDVLESIIEKSLAIKSVLGRNK